MTRFVLAGVLALGTAAGQSWAPAESIRVGLSLSGGGALGLAHIGVLKVLEREGIAVAALAGTSMGSMVGGLYAAGYSATQIESLTVRADWNTLFSSRVPFGARYLPERRQSQRYALQLRHRNFVPYLPGGIIPLQNVEFLLMELLADIEYNTGFDFDQLPLPYRAVAVDLVTGRRVVLKDGRLEQAIRASIAIPGVFSPEVLDSLELVDGGVQQRLPVDPLLEFRPDFIVAVLTRKNSPEAGISLVDVASRSIDLVSVSEIDGQRALADVVIEPDVDPFRHSDFARAADLIAAGELAAKRALPEIRRKLAGRVPAARPRAVPYRPRPYVRSVRFEGLVVTRAMTARHGFETRPGQVLSFARLVDDLERVFHTGLFDDVNYRLEEAPGDSVDVVVEVQERPYGFYALGVRYDNTDDIVLGLEAGQGNLLGSGASARAALTLGNPTEARAGLTGTRLFSLPFGYRLDAFWGALDRAYWRDRAAYTFYSAEYRGAVAEAGYILGRDAFFDLGLNLYWVQYRSRPLALPDTPEREWVAGPTFRFESNTFRDVDFPGPGNALRVEAFYSYPALPGQREFLKAELEFERGLPVARRLLLRGGVGIGAIIGRAAWFEQFRTGGGEFVGFADAELTTPFRAVVRGRVDYRLFNLLGRSDYPVYVQALADAGLFDRPDRLQGEVEPLDALHWGAGVGVRTNTPAGPLQLTLGLGDFLKPAGYAPPRLELWLSVGREFRYTR